MLKIKKKILTPNQNSPRETHGENKSYFDQLCAVIFNEIVMRISWENPPSSQTIKGSWTRLICSKKKRKLKQLQLKQRKLRQIHFSWLDFLSTSTNLLKFSALDLSDYQVATSCVEDGKQHCILHEVKC